MIFSVCCDAQFSQLFSKQMINVLANEGSCAAALPAIRIGGKNMNFGNLCITCITYADNAHTMEKVPSGCVHGIQTWNLLIRFFEPMLICVRFPTHTMTHHNQRWIIRVLEFTSKCQGYCLGGLCIVPNYVHNTCTLWQTPARRVVDSEGFPCNHGWCRYLVNKWDCSAFMHGLNWQ